ncbi:extracellular solute-binding protein [Vallitalea pronyensis]|uniref:Extracellular solute-binding protein n=1 Tax=Vallitalea pronyensis TaxID=1348613 RepID=A0A8J8MH09_9FIRM|nr:extracellular solute-binding protein [Vallitalea pronyensis]QUI21429.1 extracellular solute-binding protein [Vallitalea pronyensis]
MKKRIVEKKFVLIMSLICVCLTLLAGCGKKEEDTGGEQKQTSNGQTNDDSNKWSGTVKVQLIGNWAMDATTDPITGQKRKGVDVLKDEFEKRYPGATLEFILMGWDSYTQKTQAMLTVGECDVYQAPGIASFAVQGLLEPLQPYIEKDNFDLNTYIKGQVEGWKAMGPDDKDLQIYGLPVLGDTRVIMYDTKIFDDWGVVYLSDNPTLQELEEKAAKMTGKNPKTGDMNYGLSWKGKDSADTMVNIAELKGGSWGEGFKPNELTFNFNSKAFVEASNWLLDMKKYAPEGIVTGQGLEKWGTENNNIAIHLREFPGNVINFDKIEGLEGRYKITKLFINEKEGMGGMFAGSPFVIGENSKNKDLAWEFLKFSSSDFYQQFILEEYQQVPCVNSAFEWESIKSSDNMTVMLDSMQYLWTPRYPYRAGQPRYILTDAVERFMLNDATVEEALADAQKEADDWVKSLN